MTLFELASRTYSADQGTKPPAYYRKYDQVFRDKGFTPSTIFEIGVDRGESTKVFSACYPKAKIVGVDINQRDIDFSGCPNVTYLKADQSDKFHLDGIVATYFPSGIDLVIDDASHVGALSRLTFQIVFPHVRSGGLYIVEDWGTGYWERRGGLTGDGHRYEEFPVDPPDINRPTRIRSHDYGMVGFVKSLVDMTSEPDIRQDESAPPIRESRLSSLEFTAGICIAQKA